MPIACCGRKEFKFNLIKFAEMIAKNSKTKVIIVKNMVELSKYLKNLISDEIIIGIRAGTISKWMSDLNIYYDFRKLL